jgi:hypothetical protein
MDNRIRQILVRDRSLVPAQAEVWITVVPEQETATTEVRGRLMGPRCPYASTVEVAYPVRPLPPGQKLEEPCGLSVRVLIPEASLWEPQCPFLYQGPIELWQDGQCRDRLSLSHGLRSLQLNERGLLINGRPLTLRGRGITECSEEEAQRLHQAGFNLLLAPVEEATLPLWERADRLGFLMLGQVKDDNEPTRRCLEAASRHASCLGWLIEDVEHPAFPVLPPTGLVGLRGETPPGGESLAVVHFLVGPPERANLGMPLLVQGEAFPSARDGCLILGNIV